MAVFAIGRVSGGLRGVVPPGDNSPRDIWGYGGRRPGDGTIVRFVAFRTRRPRSRRLTSAPALALAAALAAVVPTAACTSAPASSNANTTASVHGPASPAITTAQAQQVFDAYVATSAKAARTGDGPLALSVVTGTQRAVLAAGLGSHPVVVHSTSSGSAYSSSLNITPSLGQHSYGTPTFYLPERAGYPRFFVADVPQTLTGAAPGSHATTTVGGATIPVDGPALMLFEQSARSDPWLLASDSQLPAGGSLPKLATDGTGHIPIVQPSAAALLAQPDYVGPLQAAVVDDGPASTATKTVAGGTLTTGMYQGAVNHVDGMRAPHGDVYQWELEGSSLPEFALRTADGGALVFYAMTLNTTVAVPDVINKTSPIHSGPPIQVPLDLRTLLPTGQPAPRVELQSQQLLSFAAIDPPTNNAKIQVVAIGGGLTYASAS